MSAFQTILAAIFVTIFVTIGMLLLFRDPIPYAYNNIEESLSQSLHKRGAHWARVSVDGDKVVISGIAPSAEDLRLVKSVVASEGQGVSASFQGVEVKSTVRTEGVDDQLADIDSFREKFEQENPQGRYQLPADATGSNAARYNGSDAGKVSSGVSAGTSPAGTSAAAAQSSDDSAAPTPTLVLNWRPLHADCQADAVAPEARFPLFFRGETAALLAETLTNLDLLSAYYRECRSLVSITADQPLAAPDQLTSRRLDEVRYYLMGTGVEPEAILIK
ncbi:hypothetical protein Q4485_04655 [Granulosicoccaceae sp. 1_MG-2023]|nr:hypothetical protein [Granulosicoccaceae sp. 1_MG-2023]